MDCFVTEETNSAAAESREFWTRDKLIARHQLSDLIQWVTCYFDLALDSQFDDLQLGPVGFDDDPRIDTDKGEASGYVVFLSRFKQETVTAADLTS